jgi:hypothetical protein
LCGHRHPNISLLNVPSRHFAECVLNCIGCARNFYLGEQQGCVKVDFLYNLSIILCGYKSIDKSLNG